MLCATPMGYVINMILIAVGVLFMAMPLGIMGNHLVQALEQKDKIILVHEFRDYFFKRGHSSNWVKQGVPPPRHHTLIINPPACVL